MIRINKRSWDHIQRYHTSPQFTHGQSKSKFFSTVDLIALITQAAKVPPIPNKRNLQRVFDAGRPVAIDRATGKATSIVTVSTRPNGDLITMLPGCT